MLSAHTAKRRAYFNEYSIPHKVVGIDNLSNKDIHVTSVNKYITNNGDRFKYVLRLIYAFRIIKENKLEDKDVLILRGWEFVILRWLVNGKVYIELTDIPNIVLKHNILLVIFKLIYSRGTLLVTSRAFSKLLKSKKSYLWHNVSYPINIAINKSSAAYKSNRIIYAGYLRGIERLYAEAKWVYDLIDFHGKRNIIGEGDFFVTEENYIGEYNYCDLNNIYKNYILGYVTDFFGLNSALNLTNRIYEVILNGALPIQVKDDNTTNFLNTHSLVYINTPEQLDDMLRLSEEEIMKILSQNMDKLLKVIKQDNDLINSLMIS